MRSFCLIEDEECLLKTRHLNLQEAYFFLAEDKNKAFVTAITNLTDLYRDTNLLVAVFYEDKMNYCHPERYRMDTPNHARKTFVIRELI